MIKLYIPSKEKSRFVGIFNFLLNSQSRLYITSEAIEFSNQSGVGKISKEAFVDYEVQNSKHITIPQDKKQMVHWIKNWKSITEKNGRRDLLEISI